MSGAHSGGTATLTAPLVALPSQGRTRELMALGIHPVSGLGVAEPQVKCGPCVHRIEKTVGSKTVTKCHKASQRRHGGPDVPADLRGCEGFEQLTTVPVTFKVVASTTVYEYWQLRVPEELAADGDNEALAKYLMEYLNLGLADFQSQEVTDEQDREFVAVYTVAG